MDARRAIRTKLGARVACVLALAACNRPSAANKAPEQVTAPVTASPVANDHPSGPTGPGSGAKMTPQDRALDAFNTYAAQQLHTTPKATRAQFEQGADDPIDPELTIGAALPIRAGKVGPDGSLVEPVLKGWATPDGVAITMKDHFGTLLEQAGVWDAKPSDQLKKLPKAMVWLLGSFYSTYGEPPVVKLGPDGAGTVTIPLYYQQGGGGGYVSPMMKTAAVATVTKDHHATVEVLKPQ